MKVGFLQFEPVFGEVKQNLDTVTTALADVTCDVMVLPELFASGYQFTSRAEVERLAEPIPTGMTTQRLLQLARERAMALVAGLPEVADGRLYNSAILVRPDGFVGCYRKTHLFFEETQWFTPGSTGFEVWPVGSARVGIMICFDWLYPESARTLALKGADIICHPSNLVLPYCPDAMITRCLENRVFAVTANRIGTEARGGKPPLRFIGLSEVVTPRGRILYRAASDRPDLHVADILPHEARDKSLNPYNDLLADRRPDQYEMDRPPPSRER